MDEKAAAPPSDAKGPTNTEATPVAPGTPATSGASAPPTPPPVRGGLFGPVIEQSPEMMMARTKRNLKVIGIAMALLGAFVLYNFGNIAFVYSKTETWDNGEGATFVLTLVNADNGTLTFSYPPETGVAAHNVTLAKGIGREIKATRAHVFATLEANGKKWEREMFVLKGTIDGDVDVASNEPLHINQFTEATPEAARFYYVFAGAGLLILLGGVASFLMVMRPVALVGAATLVIAGVLLGNPLGTIGAILLGAAGIFAFINIRRAKPLFAPGFVLKHPKTE